MNSNGNQSVSNLSKSTSVQHRLILKKLGHLPKRSLEAMGDNGLSDDDIGRYFQITPALVRRLRRAFERRTGIV